MRKTNGETVKKEKRNTDFVKLIGIFSVMLVLFTFTGCLGCDYDCDCNMNYGEDDVGYAYVALYDDGGLCTNADLCIAGTMTTYMDTDYNFCGMGDYNDSSCYLGLVTSNCLECEDSSDEEELGTTFAAVIGCGDTECGIGCLDGCPCVWASDEQEFGGILPVIYFYDQALGGGCSC